jgi:8-oxo-dGTP pyrophosphatase MutT (NUDIX family)
VATTWDGTPIAEDEPTGCAVVVRRADGRFLVLHRAANGIDFEGDWAWTSPAGCRQPGEPVYAAALRELHEEAGIEGADVWAVDLSGRWALFATDEPDDLGVRLLDREHDRFEWLPADEAMERILPAEIGRNQVTKLGRIPRVEVGFRPMAHADLPDVVAWVNAPHVAKWWDNESPDLAGAERHYGPAIDGVDPTRLWVLEVDGAPAGFVQDYRIGDHPDYALLTGLPDAVGFDYAIGDARWVNRGIGTRMLWSYLRDVVVPAYPAATQLHAAPDHRNTASLRVLDKLGFRQGLWFDEPRRDGRVDTVVGCTLDVAHMFGMRLPR